ncbi:hypothetical protein LTR85_004501 [Meristemomyces frigidus]|nr:hypothetical protein LTR85_004501 [Meristemomyces frigidus]
MSERAQPKKTGKRPASTQGASSSNVASKRSWQPAKNAKRSSTESVYLPQDIIDTLNAPEGVDVVNKPDSELIMEDINAGTHILVLEHNGSSSCKCRADKKCAVKPLHYDDRIRSPYRVNLRELNPSNVHWTQAPLPERFYHVSCIEAIGVDLAKCLTLPGRKVSGHGPLASSTRNSFHPAITDWIGHKGKAWKAAVYANSEYEAARKDYEQTFEHNMLGHTFGATRPGDHESQPKEPKIDNFISSGQERSQCHLADVLLDVMGGDPSISPADKIRIVEFFWRGS